MSAETKVKWSGGSGTQYLTDRHLQHILARERILGWARYSTTIYQGSFNYGVAASAGTHDGGNCADCVSNKEATRITRILGSARFPRTVAQGFTMKHDHEILDYGGSTAWIAKNQLVSYHNHRNGLRGNGPDTGYRMMVFPKFIYNGYIGYVRAKKSTFAYEQQTNKSKKITAIEIGLITFVVAETEVAGSRWYVTLSGKCIKASEFDKINYSFKASKQTYFIKKKVWARTQPNSKAAHYGSTPRLVGTRWEGAGRATVNGNVWITSAGGKAVPLSTLTTRPTTPPPVVKPPVVAPKPPAPPAPVPAKPLPTSTRVTLATRNVSRWRIGTSERMARLKVLKVWTDGLSWERRAKLIAADAKAAGVNILATQEQGRRVDAEFLADKLGSKWKTILHGDDSGDITQANFSDEVKSVIIDEGKFTTAGTDHEYVTWTKHQLTTGAWFFLCNFHTYHKAGGKSTAGNTYDHLRFSQTEAGVTKMEKIAKGAIVIYTGDFNSGKSNPFDGPARAFAAKGYVDAEGYSKSQKNPTLNSAHPLTGPTPKTNRQIDRFFIKKELLDSGKLVIHQWGVTYASETKPGSDHYQVFIVLDIRTK